VKINQPVTDKEVKLEEGDLIVSTTDLKGKILSVNRSFIEMSGFSRSELIGQNQNIVRHPDMPPAAFEDLWLTIKDNKPWSGMVKNRCKNGDFYWVFSNVTPIREAGHITGYMSVRTRPTANQISQADTLYKQLNAGKGVLRKGGLSGALSRLSIKTYLLTNYLTVFSLAMGLSYLVVDKYALGMSVLLASAVATVVFVGLFGKLMTRHVMSPIQEANKALENLASSNYSAWVNSTRGDELGDLLRNINTCQVRIGYSVFESNVFAAKSSRIQVALDSVKSAIVLLNEDNNIIYHNDACSSLLKQREADFKQSSSTFNAQAISSLNVSDLGGEFTALLSSNASDFEKGIDIKLGAAHLRVSGQSVVNDKGRATGRVFEIEDRTEQVNVEQDIQKIIENAKSGDLSARVCNTGGVDFLGRMGAGINELVDTNEKLIEDASESISSIAKGDLTRPMAGKYYGSFDVLSSNINQTIKKLAEVMGDINSGSTLLLGSSHEITQGNLDLSQRTEEQASSLEETASSMEEMTSSVRQNADNAMQANQLALGARNTAEQGGGVVSSAISAMGEITSSSKKISDIIGVIDEIAFQTNLLALNAAVEAARAGEQGRGFAVVASEVRNLAGRSATAAKEIKDLIGDSVKKVEEGSKLVDQSGQTLEEIMGSIKKVSDIVAEIAAASQEQSDGIEQVNKAVSQMDEMTQQNAALVEEAAAASEAVGQQAKTLSNMVSFFGSDQASSPLPMAKPIENSLPLTTAPQVSSEYLGEDRRTKERPWSKDSKTTAMKSDEPNPRVQQASQATVASSSSASSSDWEEF
jgi:methyl-accepting chemotaxis protein